MKECGPATEQEMLDTFLRAELDSPRFRHLVVDAAAAYGIATDDILLAEYAGRRRAILLRYRGAFLTGFPRDVTWRRVELSGADVPRLWYSGYPAWVRLSGGTRRVIDGAANIDRLSIVRDDDRVLNEEIRALALTIERGWTYPELIAVEGPNEAIILVEGHSRATAAVYARTTRPLAVLLGSSRNMRQWRWY
jgi:hypothetical protein